MFVLFGNSVSSHSLAALYKRVSMSRASAVFCYSSLQQNVKNKDSSRDFTACAELRLYNLLSLWLFKHFDISTILKYFLGYVRIHNKAACFYHSNQKYLLLLCGNL